MIENEFTSTKESVVGDESNFYSYHLTLFSEADEMYELWLPKFAEGFYRFSNQSEHRFLSVVAKNGKWYARCMKPAHFKETPLGNNDEIPLEGKMLLTVDVEDQTYLLLVEQVIPHLNAFKNYNTLSDVEIIIGSQAECDIYYRGPFVAEKHAMLLRTGGRWTISNLDTEYGIYVNKEKCENAELVLGDVVYIMGLKLIIGQSFLTINSGLGEVVVNPCILQDMPKILVKVSVPAIGEEYDMLIPDFLRIKSVTPLIAETVENLSNHIYISSGAEYLCSVDKNMPFMPLPPEKLKAGVEENSRHRRLFGEKLPEPAHGSKRLKQIVLKACAYDPNERYQTATEMLQDIDSLFGIPKPKPPKSVEPVPPEPTPEPPVPSMPPQPENKKSKLPAILGIVAACAIVIILLLLRSCDSGGQPQGTEGSEQLTWSDWTDELPAGITADKYEIEEKTLYSSRIQETTSSTEKNTMDGWELFNTVEANGEFGPWSDWSATKVDSSATRKVETQTRYRYRDKETTTSTFYTTKDGWTKYDTTYSWSNYGPWSAWSTSAVSGSDSRKVETKTQYRYRSISYSTEYTGWSSWSSWSFDRQSTSDLKKEDSRYVYGYYYYTCPNCGAHMHGWDIYCPTWAGGCGKGWITEDMWTQIYSTTSWNDAGLKDWYGTGKYYAYVDGQLVFKWTGGGSGTQYRYATRSTQQVKNYGSWSSWGDTAYSSSSSRQVETRKVYRYCDRSQVATYHFYRWGSWSNWSENKVSATNDRQVENTTYYRYRDQVKTTTYYFKRWTDWSTYSETVVTPSETVEVQTKTQYRYKYKGN